MRIVQVTHRYPPQTGGIERHVAAISEGLVSEGHEVVVVSADRTRGDPIVDERNGVVIRRHRGLSPGGAYHLAPGILRGVRQAAGDVVHAHNYHAFPLLLAAVAVRDERFVVTPHYHAAGSTRLRERLLRLYRPFGARAVRRADAVVAVSRWERDRLVDTFGVEPRLVPNGIDVHRFREADPEDRQRPYLLCVGRLTAYKGVQFAIDALDRLPGYELVVVGTGPYRSALRRASRRRGVADRVTFLGRVEDDRLAGLYAGADVHLALSSVEAFGMTVGESLAAGTPCVVVRSRALGEWERFDGCVGTDERSPEALAAAIERAVDTSVAAELPTWDETVDALDAVYASL